MSDTSTIDEPDRKVKLEEFYFQRRILFGCTIGLFVATLMWIVAMATNRWFIVSGGPGIFVESHRRYFKSSHTGIWRNCRYAIVPQPVSSSIVRNFTTLAASMDELPKLKSQIEKEDFMKDFLKVELPDLETITAINESFRQHLFAQWVLNKDDEPRFKALTSKLHNLTEKHPSTQKNYLDPTNYDLVNQLGELIVDVEVNKTSKIKVAIPQDLRFALFDGWDNNGFIIIRVLYYYAKSLNIDMNLYYKGNKYVFRPPLPTKKVFNGFLYHNWRRCTHHNLFADEEEIKADPSVDEDMLDLSRTSATFSIITVFVMCLGFIFTVYTFLNPRYMFKRLAGGVHFIAGLTSATVCRVLVASVEHARENLSYAFPAGANYTYGYGFYFGIIVSTVNFFSCIMFLWYSKKKKGDKAATEELGMADEAIEIGR